MFGGLISGAILEYMPPIYFSSWQWMFIIEGGITVLVGVFAFFYLTSSPKEATWLNEDEKKLLEQKLNQNTQKIGEISISKTLFDLNVWKFVFVYFCIQLSVYGVLFYLPTKIAFFMDTKVGFTVGLLNAIPWIFVFFALPIITKKADFLMAHIKFTIVLLILAVVGMSVAAFASNLIIFLIFITIASIGFIVIQPIFWNLPTQILKGKSAAAGIALIGSLGNLGGFVAPNLKNYAESFTGYSYSGLLALAVVAIFGIFMLIHLKNTIKF